MHFLQLKNAAETGLFMKPSVQIKTSHIKTKKATKASNKLLKVFVTYIKKIDFTALKSFVQIDQVQINPSSFILLLE